MKKVKLAIIGATGTALKRTIPALKGSSICRVSAIQGRDIAKLEKISNEYAIPEIYTDVKEMLTNAEYDCVFIATPPFLHKTHIAAAIENGKPIICEKPLAPDYEEGKKIAVLLQNYTADAFMLAHHLRHQKAVDDIRELIRSGGIGKVLSASMQWGFEMNLDAPNSLWKNDPAKGGEGAFNDNGVHLVDLAIHLFGQPRHVTGQIDRIRTRNTYDNETAYLFYDGFSIQLQASQSMRDAGNHLLIYGTEGSIEAFGAMGEKSIERIFVKKGGTCEVLQYPPTNLFAGEIEDFCSNLLEPGSGHKGTTLQEAVAALRIIERMREAATKKTLIQV